MVEEWRKIPKSKGQYEASNTGKIRNAYTGRVLKAKKLSGGNMGVGLQGWMGTRTWTVMQLVGMAFLPNAKRLKHKGDITDDRLENIEVLEEYDD